MAPKPKKNSLWSTCSKCTVDVPQKEFKSHTENSCPSSPESWLVPFVFQKIFYTFIEFKELDLSLDCSEDYVLIHPSTIQLCNLVIGEPVLISIESDTSPYLVRRVWPLTGPITSVLVSQKGLENSWHNLNHSKCFLKCFEVPLLEADTVFVCTEEPLAIKPEFKDFLCFSQVNKIISQGHSISVNYFGKNITLNFLSISTHSHNTSKTQWFVVNNSTKWIVQGPTQDVPMDNDFTCIGGVDEVLNEIQSMIQVALHEPLHFTRIKLIRSILLYGPSGTGKTLICRSIASQSNVNVIQINASDIYSKFYGETESTLKKIFGGAIKNYPSIIILDEIDVLCPKRNSYGTEQEKRIVSSLATLLDSIHEVNTRVFVLANSNKLESLDPSLRRYGRIDREIEISVPDADARFEILSKLLSRVSHSLTVENIRTVSDAAHGFVGADISNLCTQASLSMLKKTPTKETLDLSDFEFALKHVSPSAMREVLIDIPQVKWSDIGGQDDLKLKLKQAVEWPLKYSESFTRLGIKAPSGILMYGPPGCSKTMIAKAVAHESGLNFLSIKGPELFSKWVGESERAVRELFRKARQVAPSIIFFDEIDALGSERSKNGNSSSNVQDRILAQLLTELDGISPLGNVTIIAATNRPDKIDSALLRPGRLDRIIHVPLPDKMTREAILKLKLSKMPLSQHVCINELVQKTEGFSGAEVNAICNEAALKALEENINIEEVSPLHFADAFKIIQPRTPLNLLMLYDKFEKQKL